MSRNTSKQAATSKVINIAPYEYVHVKDNNSSLVKVVVGPKTFVIQDHEELVGQVPQKMIIIPPMHYVCIRNPVILVEKDGKMLPEQDKFGQIKVAHAEIQYRFHEQYKTAFFLYYGEEMVGNIEKLKIVKNDEAFKLKALRKFKHSESGTDKQAGDEWLFYGPRVFYPSPEVEFVSVVNAITIGPSQALRVKAKQNFVDRDGLSHKAGEEWLIRTQGAYILDVYEELVRLENPIVINDKQAIYLRAVKAYKDYYGREHRAGDEWLITPDKTTWHVLDIFEERVSIQNMIILTKDQYAVVLNPIDENGKNQKGSKKLVVGEKSFFLQPGEELERGIQLIKVLNENQALLLQAKEKFKDSNGEEHLPGDKWMIKGPRRYVPDIEIEIVEERSVIPLDEKEGIYVRDIKNGTVRSVIGKSYLLESNEELWQKDISSIEEQILLESNPGQKVRDKTRVVSYKCPYNSVMQVYNYKTEKSRIIFGPELVMLEPDEQFCLMFLSGKTPKVPGVIKTLALSMGPTYTTDKIEVETSDHALLIVEVAYNWFFDVDRNDEDQCKKIFSVRDCIGEMCSIMASRVRGAVAELTLNEFHKNSARIIRKAVMGEVSGKINDKYIFQNNQLGISNVDIKNISTKDQKTKEKLQVTVNLAIELTTKSQEEEAKRQADLIEQEAKSLLQRKIIDDNSTAEELKRNLYTLMAKTKAIEEQGTAEAVATARVNTERMEYQTKIKLAKDTKDLKNSKNKFQNEIEAIEHEIKMNFDTEKTAIEINKKTKLSEIETMKFQKMIDAIGQDTLREISLAGPQAQVQLLSALGLSGFVMTDGNSPINLYGFANNLAKKD
jgi:major vault protein